MPPPCVQSVSRKRVGVTSSPATIAPGGGGSRSTPERLRSTRSRRSVRSRGAGAEIVIVRRVVAGDLLGQRRKPRGLGGRCPPRFPASAGAISSSSSSIAAWNSRMAPLSASSLGDQPLDLRDRRRDGAPRSACCSALDVAGRQAAARSPRRGGTAGRPRCPARRAAPSAQPVPACARPLRLAGRRLVEIALRPARQAPAPRARRPRPRRGNAAPCPAAPWPPSP